MGNYKDPNGIASGKYQTPGLAQAVIGPHDVILLRYADVLLMYAEAENALNGPTAEALKYLNMVRQRAGASLYPASGWTKASLQEAIYWERYMELTYEFHELFDIRRLGKTQEVVQQSVQAQAAGTTYDPKLEIYPIPQRELDANPLLTQNPGY